MHQETSYALLKNVSTSSDMKYLTAKGRSSSYIDKVAPHKVHKGNRPTNTLLMNQIFPFSLGSLIAIYEHKIFVQGIILQICFFDQWGVELGKGLASKIENELHNNVSNQSHDNSTLNLIKHYQEVKIRT